MESRKHKSPIEAMAFPSVYNSTVSIRAKISDTFNSSLSKDLISTTHGSSSPFFTPFSSLQPQQVHITPATAIQTIVFISYHYFISKPYSMFISTLCIQIFGSLPRPQYGRERETRKFQVVIRYLTPDVLAATGASATRPHNNSNRHR